MITHATDSPLPSLLAIKFSPNHAKMGLLKMWKVVLLELL